MSTRVTNISGVTQVLVRKEGETNWTTVFPSVNCKVDWSWVTHSSTGTSPPYWREITFTANIQGATKVEVDVDGGWMSKTTFTFTESGSKSHTFTSSGSVPLVTVKEIRMYYGDSRIYNKSNPSNNSSSGIVHIGGGGIIVT